MHLSQAMIVGRASLAHLLLLPRLHASHRPLCGLRSSSGHQRGASGRAFAAAFSTDQGDADHDPAEASRILEAALFGADPSDCRVGAKKQEQLQRPEQHGQGHAAHTAPPRHQTHELAQARPDALTGAAASWEVRIEPLPDDTYVQHSFAELGVPSAIQRSLEERGITAPTEIQDKAIPEIRKGGTVLIQGGTGTGKTLAFLLPLVRLLLQPPKDLETRPQLLTAGLVGQTAQERELLEGNGAERARKRLRAVILTPSKELGAQIESQLLLLLKYVLDMHFPCA